MDPKHHQLQHPQAELLRLMMPFTHSCKASRQGGALSPICWAVTGASSKRALANLPSTLGVTSVPPFLLRPSDLMSQGISTRRLEGPSAAANTFLRWLLSVKGALSSSRGWSCTPPLMLIKSPGPSISPLHPLVHQYKMSFLPQGSDIESSGINKYQLLWAAHMLFPFLENKKCSSVLFKLNNIPGINPIS